MVGPNANKLEFATLTICKNIEEKFVIITILLKESMILLKGQKYNFIKQNY